MDNNIQVTHNNDNHHYRIAMDIAKEGSSLWDLTPYIKGRVGDNRFGLQVTWTYQGQLMNIEGMKPYIEGNVGQYSVDDKNNLQLDPNSGVVRYVGDPADCQAGGQATYYFPEQMFPKAGIFKGYLGLIDDSDGYQHLSGVNVWFKVLPGVAYMGKASAYYISEIDKLIHNSEERIRQLLDQGQKDVDAKQAALQAIVDDYKAKMSDLIDRLNAQGKTANSMMETVKAGLSALEAKIQQDGLFTQAEADAFKTAIQSQLDKEREKINDAVANLQGKFPDYAKETADFAGHNLMHNGHIAVYKKTFGEGKDASGMSVMVNSNDDPEVQNNSLDWIAKHYTGRDSAAIYASNTRIPYLFCTTSTKFTENSVTVLDESIDLSDVKPGMLIDTSVRANIDKDWYVTSVVSVEGRTINTNLWYKVQSNPNANTVTGTPADGLAITVNPMIGVWGANFNIYIPQEDAESGTALELGVFSKSKTPQDIVGLRITSGGEFINNGSKVTGSYSNAYDAANTDGGTAYNVDPNAKTDFYFRAQNPDKSANWFVNNQGQLMHESIVPHFATDASGDYGKDDSLIIVNGDGDQTINLDYGRYGRIVRVVAMSEGTKTIYAKPESSSMIPGTSWFLDAGNGGKNVNSLTLNKATGKVAVTLLDTGSVFVAL